MRKIGIDLGFSMFECLSPPVSNFAAGIKKEMGRVFAQQSIDVSKLDFFDFVFDGIGNVYESVMKNDLKANFSFFCFVK
jgi:hypothetical protein